MKLLWKCCICRIRIICRVFWRLCNFFGKRKTKTLFCRIKKSVCVWIYWGTGKWHGAYFLVLVFETLSILTHLFPMHPFSIPWKHQKTKGASGMSNAFLEEFDTNLLAWYMLLTDRCSLWKMYDFPCIYQGLVERWFRHITTLLCIGFEILRLFKRRGKF